MFLIKRFLLRPPLNQQYPLSTPNNQPFHSFANNDFNSFTTDHLETPINQVAHNPFLHESINTNMYFNHLINNISNKMYCAANNNINYPAFQGNFKNEGFTNSNNLQLDFNETKPSQNPKKKIINEENNMNSDIFPNLNNLNNQQKSFMKNTYTKKINS